VSADPIGSRDDVQAAIPRQRDAGVMGYVAEIQQFDDTMTAAETTAAETVGTGDAAEPPLGGEAEPEPGAAQDRPDAEAPVGVPPRQWKPPWTRTEVGLAVVFVVVAAVAIVGGAYAIVAANRPPTGELPLPMPTIGVAAPELPAEATPDGGAAITASPTPQPPPSRAGGGLPADPPRTRAPESTGAAPAPVADLTASYAREANTGLLGLTGYRGKITVSNRGTGAATTWQVTLSLPAGQQVSDVEGAEARQEGELVTFTPAAGAGAVGPGAAVEFTFEVPGLLAGEPTGCAINDRPCD
jgi:Cellulose binding domain